MWMMTKHTHKKRKVQSIKKHRIEIPNPDGTVTYMEPKNSLWYLLYIISEPQSKRQKTYPNTDFVLALLGKFNKG